MSVEEIASGKAAETQRHWENLYQGNPPESLPWEENRPAAELVALIESGVVEKGAALDICCGTGNNAVYLAKQGFKCYGIDISPTALRLARQKAAKEGVKCELMPGNAVELPYPYGKFTLVFDRGCFHSISPEDRETFVRGIHRVLKPTGKYLLECFSSKDHTWGPPYGFSPGQIRGYFSPLFHIEFLRELSPPTAGTKGYFLSGLMKKPD